MSSDKQKEAMAKGKSEKKAASPPPAYTIQNASAYPRMAAPPVGPPAYYPMAPSTNPAFQYQYPHHPCHAHQAAPGVINQPIDNKGGNQQILPSSNLNYPTVVPQPFIQQNVALVMPDAFDAQARFDHNTRPNVPPPPPGVAPNMAQIAVMQGQSNQIILGQKKQDFW